MWRNHKKKRKLTNGLSWSLRVKTIYCCDLSQAKMLEAHAQFDEFFVAKRATFGVQNNIPVLRHNFRQITVTVCHISYTLSAMTSSLRNSLHRRNHKERSQPAHRSKLGVLEKHGDYVKRARDYHSKQDRLNRLKQKAAERNKDEFYFSMTKEKTKVIFAQALSLLFSVNFARKVSISKAEEMSPFQQMWSKRSRHRTKTISGQCGQLGSRFLFYF